MMYGQPKRKWPLLRSKASRKVLVLGQSTRDIQDGKSRSLRPLSSDKASMPERQHRGGFVGRMRENSSKLLSLVGIHKNRGPRTSDSSEVFDQKNVVPTIFRKDGRSSNSDKHSVSASLALISPLPAAEYKLTSSIATASGRTSFDEHQPKHNSLIETWQYTGHQKQRESQTSPGQAFETSHDLPGFRFANRVSHKLSSTFGNPTIVHRPSYRDNSALSPMRGGWSPEVDKYNEQETGLQESTAPSSCSVSGNASGNGVSTAKTSLDTNMGFLSYSTPAACAPDGFAARPSNAHPVSIDRQISPPIKEALTLVQPTIVTVETTANAKIFFETHFNSLLASNATPRSTRRKDLEARFEALGLSEDRRHQERLAWAIQESEYLRRTRALKSRTHRISNAPGVAVADYEIVKMLGKGSFGVVRLVRDKEDNTEETSSLILPETVSLGTLGTSKHPPESQKLSQEREIKVTGKGVYAMKVIRKSDMLRNCQEGHLRAERDFLVASEKSRWIVPLVASFQDATNLYLVMEYMVGGDFLGLLFRRETLKEKHARWYIAEMILCVEEAHKLRWIHRDVKPDNFLISASGHLKISDFGLAFDGHWSHDQRYFKSQRQNLMEKLCIYAEGDAQDQLEDAKIDAETFFRPKPNDKTMVDGPKEHESILQWRNRSGKRRLAASAVGTSQYMAPEVIRGDPYDGRCDWWSIGIILYECLYGFTPFVSEKREDTKMKILNNATTLVFPTEDEVNRKEKVSYEAMELINSLLQEREHRLSSPKYRLNDFQHSKRPPGKLIPKRSDPYSIDYQGNFVYADDASDIKAHRFFHRIAWNRIHLSRPPFVPDVSGQDDTKYFDEEEPLSDVDDGETISNDQEISGLDTREGLIGDAHVTQVDGPLGRVPPKDGTEVARRNKKKKRPRDKVLRDKFMGRKVLDIRKKAGFSGYEYRRPKLPQLVEERGRYQTAKRSTVPSFDG